MIVKQCTCAPVLGINDQIRDWLSMDIVGCTYSYQNVGCYPVRAARNWHHMPGKMERSHWDMCDQCNGTFMVMLAKGESWLLGVARQS